MQSDKKIIPEERVIIKDDERIDDLQRNGYHIIQKKSGFCFGMDAVLLSGFAKVKPGEKVIDLGTGTGIIPILLEAKTEGRIFFGVEIQDEVAEMASRSVRLNSLEEKVLILKGDIKELGKRGSNNILERVLPKKGSENGNEEVKAEPGSFDVVTSNPPYMNTGHGLKNPMEMKNISRHEVLCSLDDVCRAAGRLLKSGGRFYMVHRPHRLSEIVSSLKAYKLEPKRMKFVHPFIDRDANMVLIESVKSGGSQVTVEKPVIVYESEGKYTREIYDIYGY